MGEALELPESAMIVQVRGGKRSTVETIEDDELRLIFICCHPALPPDAID